MGNFWRPWAFCRHSGPGKGELPQNPDIMARRGAVRRFAPNELDRFAVRGQYVSPKGAGHEALPGYRQEEGVTPDSDRETFAALRLFIDNWRWKGIPFYLRAGKRLAKRLTEIAIVFKTVPHSIFGPLLPEHLAPNVLVLNVQPCEGVSLSIQAKQPGPKLCMGELTLHFSYKGVFGGNPPEAYERLLLDTMLGDQSLFIRQDMIEEAWSILTPVLETWEGRKPGGAHVPLYEYECGSWGPAEADNLPGRDGRAWRKP